VVIKYLICAFCLIRQGRHSFAGNQQGFVQAGIVDWGRNAGFLSGGVTDGRTKDYVC